MSASSPRDSRASSDTTRPPGEAPATGSPLERETARWLGWAESRAILPMKWGMLAVVLFSWLWGRDWLAPSTAAASLFIIYGAITAGEHFLFARDRVAIAQMRPVAMGSYIIDLVFITAVVYLDAKEPSLLRGLNYGPSTVGLEALPPGGSDYYFLYFLLVMRGFVLFRRPIEHLAVASLLSVLFVASVVWQGQGLDALASKAIALRLALIWAVLMLATFILDVFNKQKSEVLRARERLVRAEGLASLGELTAGVAHEINNPIGIIKTYAEYLERASDDNDPDREDFATIRQEAERCERIVRRMMDFANPEVREMSRFNVAEVTSDVMRFVFGEKSGGGGVKTDLDIESGTPEIFGERNQVRQALLNVVMNARQIVTKHYDEPGSGQPHVRVRVRQLPGPRAPVEISVHDNGPGISPEDAERAFDPFFTRRDGGTGLGLAITRRIVEAHGGAIAIWPAANGGTTCALTFPVAEENA
ncbi:MAG: ATP-binding protein [Sumerlaeia bacterium]